MMTAGYPMPVLRKRMKTLKYLIIAMGTYCRLQVLNYIRGAAQSEDNKDNDNAVVSSHDYMVVEEKK